MADKIPSHQRSENMRKIRSKGMKPEMAVRQLVHSLGYRYRLHGKGLPGKPDLVFTSRKKVIFVNGCFWHQHADASCRITRVPKSNLEFWVPKLERTQKRDQENLRKLWEAGWEAMVLWECQLKDGNQLRKKITAFLD